MTTTHKFPPLVSGLEVVEDTGLVEVGQVGHVLAAVELGRVHLAHQVLLEHLLLPLDGHGDLLPLGVLDGALGEASTGLVRHPTRLFRVIGLCLQANESMSIR